MPPLELARHPQHGEHGQHEHGLQLEAEGERGADHRGDGPVVERQVQRDHEQRGIAAVALGPDGAVEEHRRQAEHGEEAGDQDAGFFGEAAQEHHRAPGEQHVEKSAQQLDQIQIPDREQGKEGEKIQIRDIVVAHAVPQRAEVAVRAEEVHPLRQEVLIVERLIIKYVRARGKGKQHQQHGNDPRAAAFQTAGAPQERQRQHGLQREQQINGKAHEENLAQKQKKPGGPRQIEKCPLTNKARRW